MGPFYVCIKRDKSAGEWVVESLKKYLKNGLMLTGENFRNFLVGDEGVTTDELNDGIPDKGWTIKDIGFGCKNMMQTLVDMQQRHHY